VGKSFGGIPDMEGKVSWATQRVVGKEVGRLKKHAMFAVRVRAGERDKAGKEDGICSTFVDGIGVD
jgi:hypothetical protein